MGTYLSLIVAGSFSAPNSGTEAWFLPVPHGRWFLFPSPTRISRAGLSEMCAVQKPTTMPGPGSDES